MKIRSAFVSNSSSSSFILGFKDRLSSEERREWLVSLLPAKYKKLYLWTEFGFFSDDFVLNKEKDYQKTVDTCKKALEEHFVPEGYIFIPDDWEQVNKDNWEEYQNYIRTDILTHDFYRESDKERITREYLDVSFDQFFEEHIEQIKRELKVASENLAKMNKHGYKVLYDLCLSDFGDGVNVAVQKENGELIPLRDLEEDFKKDFYKHIIERWC